MTNGQINKTFLNTTDAKTKRDILGAIAKHYGITSQEAFEEVIDDEAEHLLDYLVGSVRTATSVLMQKHRLHAAA